MILDAFVFTYIIIEIGLLITKPDQNLQIKKLFLSILNDIFILFAYKNKTKLLAGTLLMCVACVYPWYILTLLTTVAKLNILIASINHNLKKPAIHLSRYGKNSMVMLFPRISVSWPTIAWRFVLIVIIITSDKARNCRLHIWYD